MTKLAADRRDNPVLVRVSAKTLADLEALAQVLEIPVATLAQMLVRRGLDRIQTRAVLRRELGIRSDGK